MTFRWGKTLIFNNIILHINYICKTEELKDYKFFCFNGKVRCFKVDFDRFIDHKANYYDRDANLLPFGEVCCMPDFNRIFEKPKNYNKMIEIVETLSQGIPFVRVDLYNADGNIYFGETTFFTASGFDANRLPEADLYFGNMVKLSIDDLIQ